MECSLLDSLSFIDFIIYKACGLYLVELDSKIVYQTTDRREACNYAIAYAEKRGAVADIKMG